MVCAGARHLRGCAPPKLFGDRTASSAPCSRPTPPQQVEYRHAAAGGQAVAVPVNRWLVAITWETFGEIVCQRQARRRDSRRAGRVGQRVHTRRQAAIATGANQLLSAVLSCEAMTSAARPPADSFWNLQAYRPRLAGSCRRLGRRFREQKRQLVATSDAPAEHAQGLLTSASVGFCAGPNQETNFMGVMEGTETKNGNEDKAMQPVNQQISKT